MLKKLFIIPWFGPFPEWMDSYLEHIKHLEKAGYDWFITTDGQDFNNRVEKVLSFTPQIIPGTSISHNYRTAFGLLYADKLKGYDFWGVTDLDCVYGRPSHFLPEEKLKDIDIWSNHHNYICGPWTLFRNCQQVNTLFREVPGWEQFMRNTDNQPGRWTEVEYSQVVDQKHNEGTIKRLYTHFQGKDPNQWEHLKFEKGKLYDGEEEVMTFHFNRHKIWPL